MEREERLLKRAIEIGNELRALQMAIEQASIGFTNQGRGNRSDFYSTEVFELLSNRREALRNELVDLTALGI